MRILLVAPMVPQDTGGGAIPVLLHAELLGLSERHEVSLVTAVGDEPGEAEAAAALASSGLDVHIADRRQPRAGIRRWRRRLRLAGTWARGQWPWRTVWFADPGVQEALDRLTTANSFDVAAVEDSAMSVFRLPAGLPAVLTEHEVLVTEDGVERASAGLLHRLDSKRWSSFQRSAWRRFDRVQVFTPHDAEAMTLLAPDVGPRVRVNPFGLVLPAASDPSRECAGTILFVGNFTHPPNRDAAGWLARDILPAVRQRIGEARLRIVGTAAPQEVLELAGEHVQVFADAPSVDPHLEAAAVVVAPVRTGGGMRMKVLQAMAAGKAVVTTPRGSEGFNAFGEPPPLVLARTSAEVADVTAALLRDPERRRGLGRSARVFAERHHSPKSWATRLEGVYEEACSERAGSRA